MIEVSELNNKSMRTYDFVIRKYDQQGKIIKTKCMAFYGDGEKSVDEMAQFVRAKLVAPS